MPVDLLSRVPQEQSKWHPGGQEAAFSLPCQPFGIQKVPEAEQEGNQEKKAKASLPLVAGESEGRSKREGDRRTWATLPKPDWWSHSSTEAALATGTLGSREKVHKAPRPGERWLVARPQERFSQCS